MSRAARRAPLALAALAALVLVLSLAACGPLPRPFKPEAKGTNDLLVLPDRAGVAVAAVTGDVPDGRALARAMAEALRRENVPTSVGVGNRESRWLIGTAQAIPTPADPETLRRRLVWELYDADGQPLGRVTRTVTVPADTWSYAAPKMLSRVAAEAAPEIAGLIQGPSVVESKLPGYPAGTRLVVTQVAGGPPDLAAALTRSMTERLRRQGLPVAERASPGDVVIDGTLSLGPVEAGRRALDLVWTLRREGQADALGDLRQANPVAVDRLTGQPRQLADLIVRAALPGVRQVLERGGR